MGDGMTASEVRTLTPAADIKALGDEPKLLPAPTGTGTMLGDGMTASEVKPLAPTIGVKAVAATGAEAEIFLSPVAFAEMSD